MENEELSLALARGRERERQALHGRLFQAAMGGKVVAGFFLLKCRHEGYDDRGREREQTSPEEFARQTRAALAAMDETIGSEKPNPSIGQRPENNAHAANGTNRPHQRSPRVPSKPS